MGIPTPKTTPIFTRNINLLADYNDLMAGAIADSNYPFLSKRKLPLQKYKANLKIDISDKIVT